MGLPLKKQQTGEIIGVLASALVIGFTLILLHEAYTIGSKELAAPQATLMSLVVKGIMEGTLPWALVLTGVFTALIVELFGIGSLPFAVGLYLPIHLSTPIIIGGIIRGLLKKFTSNDEDLKEKREKGILFASGLIAGDALLGVILAIVAFFGGSLALSDSPVLGSSWALIFFGLLVLSLIKYSWLAKKE